MGATTSVPVVRIRVKTPSPIKNVTAFRVALDDLNFSTKTLPPQYKDVELGCLAFQDAPFPEETQYLEFYYIPGLITLNEDNEFFYTP